jgi:hypothetical protein
MIYHFLKNFIRYFVYVGAPIYAFTSCQSIIQQVSEPSAKLMLTVYFLGLMFVVGSFLLLGIIVRKFRIDD